ncbi:MAG: cobalamin biosynthesis protein CbiD [Spirochaetes bacterium GWD1_27_9]|nr:MAG: cobalamin biosynthesis protein CbiD [Spirochaetes bacterium GWB1_27_13]OHD26764.1 MAG: cobalamin biosynthesis protein CbiD [Spirochaetes bacterium GWC1_27_15]OHD31541.1 MAG: cobalamin biosynthesis protein CbiD [Spirochaetes bacterium GWD1_27_9]
MIPDFVLSGGKKLRIGYTTGTCAEAGVKACCKILSTNKKIDSVNILTKYGLNFDIKIHDVEIGDNYVECSVIKDAGDDYDVTNGIKIFTRIKKNYQNKIIVTGGKGIGLVTKKGLMVSIGQKAINPSPMEQILQSVKNNFLSDVGINIEISCPDGIDVAKKTFNPKLGIIDGISILGTKGVVLPMSEEAFKESLSLKLSVLKEQGTDTVIFTPGNYGERFIKNNYTINEDIVVSTSNFIGFMIEEAISYGIKNILLIGHIGKLVKLAGGIFNTHSRVADCRQEILASNYFYFTGDALAFKKIMESNTTEEAIEYITNNEFFNFITNKIKSKCEEYSYNKINFGVIIFSETKGLLGQTNNITQIITN